MRENTVTVSEYEYKKFLQFKKNEEHKDLIRAYKQTFGGMIESINITDEEYTGEEILEIRLDYNYFRDWHKEVPIAEAEKVLELVHKEQYMHRELIDCPFDFEENVQKYLDIVKKIREHDWVTEMIR